MLHWTWDLASRIAEAFKGCGLGLVCRAAWSLQVREVKGKFFKGPRIVEVEGFKFKSLAVWGFRAQGF